MNSPLIKKLKYNSSHFTRLTYNNFSGDEWKNGDIEKQLIPYYTGQLVVLIRTWQRRHCSEADAGSAALCWIQVSGWFIRLFQISKSSFQTTNFTNWLICAVILFIKIFVYQIMKNLRLLFWKWHCASGLQLWLVITLHISLNVYDNMAEGEEP